MAVLLQMKTKQNTMNNMKNTNPIFSLKNFRSFGEDGADFELAPITVLTGCNSSGKSSLVKAQLLLEQVIKFINIDNAPSSIINSDLNASNKELALGNFRKILNKNSATGTITFSYVTRSNYLFEDVKVTLEFVEKKDSVLGNGEVSSICITKLDGTVIFRNNHLNEGLEEEERNRCENLSAILDNFKRFVVYERYRQASDTKMALGEIIGSKEERETANEQYKVAFDAVKQYKIKKSEIKAYNTKKPFMDVPKYKATTSWLDSGTFFNYLPIFKATEGKEKSFVRKYLLETITSQNKQWSKAIDWANHFADDFENSRYDSFLDFFISLEKEAFSDYYLQRINASYDEPSGEEWSLAFMDFREKFDKEKMEWIKIEVAPEKYNKISRKRYEENWSFKEVVDALEDIFFGDEKYLAPLEKPKREKEWAIYKDRNLMETYFSSFYIAVIKEILSPEFLQDVKYINSSSVAIKRLYSADETDKIGECLNQYLKGNQQVYGVVLSNGGKVFNKGTFINKWIKEFGIGDAIRIEGTDQGLGILAFLEKDGDKRLLADEGYGITQLFALLMQIENNILYSEKIHYGFDDNGVFHFAPSTIYVEEPEIHLHPKYQSMLADMFVEAYREYNIHFIIETHSEYLIRKLQVMVADKDNPLTSNDVSINYVEKDRNGISTNRKIEILEDGRLSGTFGSGFFDEADSLAMNLMKYKIRK